jgi:chloramphenicol O-acetyltransferase type B
MKELIRKLRFLYLTKFKWKRFSFGKDPYIGRFVYMWAKHTIKIGDNFYIGKYSQIECDAEIGDHVMFANRVALVGRYDHNYTQIGIPTRLASKIRDYDYNWKGLDSKVIIGDDVWVGYGSIILSGVKVGTGSIIAAGSVVTKDIEPYSIYAGVPAKKVANRFISDMDLQSHIKIINNKYSKNISK